MTLFRENEKGQFEPVVPLERTLLKRILNEIKWVDLQERDPQERLGHVSRSYLIIDGGLYDVTDEEVTLIKELLE